MFIDKRNDDSRHEMKQSCTEFIVRMIEILFSGGLNLHEHFS